MSEQDEIVIELRSDTFTKPSKEMLTEMINAEVGDSVYDEDPTVKKLESTVADMFGKESCLFMPSGTMANLIAIMSHCNERGSDIIVGDKSHFNLWEQGGVSQIANVYAKQIENLKDGTFDLEKFESMISDYSDVHCSRTRVVCIENTHNWCGGKIVPLKFINDLSTICSKYDIKIHLDGSRIMNASVASNLSVKELCNKCDSINFCFSKGIGAPIGSILIGSNKFIQRACKLRKVLGGGMRQTGVLAAACLYGLSKAKENLTQDHINSKKLANGILQNGVVSIDVDNVQTNIVHMNIIKKGLSCQDFLSRLKTADESELKELKKRIVVKGGECDSKTVRLLTHLNVTPEHVDFALKKINYVIKEFA